jgi:hypothetical protein
MEESIIGPNTLGLRLQSLNDVIYQTALVNDDVLRFDSSTNTWTNQGSPPGFGTVTSVSEGQGILCSPNPITTSGSVSIANTPVLPGSYTNTSLTVNQQGQLTAASNGLAPITNIIAGTGLSTTGGSTPTLSITDTTVTPGSYTYASLTVNAQGQLTAASSGSTSGFVESVTGGTGIDITGTAQNPIVNISTSGITAGTYYAPEITFNAEGQATSAIEILTTEGDLLTVNNLGIPDRLPIGSASEFLTTNGTSASWNSLDVGTGLTGDAVSTALALANTAVTPGSYTYTNLTVNAQGQLTAASSGAAPTGTVTSLTEGTGITLSPSTITTTGSIGITNTAVTAGSYTYASITVNAQGQLTAASSGSAPLTSITAGTGITVSGSAPSQTVSITNTAVSASTYYAPQLTVNAQGQLTAASEIITTQGDLLIGNSSGQASRLPISTSGWQLVTYGTSGSTATTELWIPPNVAVSNIGLDATVGSGAMTISITGSTGVALSATNPGLIRMSGVTSGFLSRMQVVITPLNVIIPSGTTIGTTNSYSGYLYIYASNNGGAIALAVSLTPFPLDALVTISAISGGSSATTLYANSALSGVSIQYLGKILAPQTTAGTWAATPIEYFPVIGQDYSAGRVVALNGDLETVINSVPARLAIGANATVLTSNGTNASWQAPATGGTVTSISAGTGLSASPSSPITSSGTLSIATTGVSASTYYAPQVAVNAEGQITSASNILTTAGDLLAYDGLQPSRFIGGVNGESLHYNSSVATGFNLQWAPEVVPMVNMGFSASVAANALTITFTQADGVSSPNNSSFIRYRSATLTSGQVGSELVTSADTISITIPSGATLGQPNSYTGYIYVYSLNGSGQNNGICVSTQAFACDGYINTTAISSVATSATTMYANSNYTSVVCTYIGKLLAPQTTAGTWATAPTELYVGLSDYAAQTNPIKTDGSLTGNGTPLTPLALTTQAGLTAGTYASVTVNSQGIITGTPNSTVPVGSTSGSVTASSTGPTVIMSIPVPNNTTMGLHYYIIGTVPGTPASWSYFSNDVVAQNVSGTVTVTPGAFPTSGSAGGAKVQLSGATAGSTWTGTTAVSGSNIQIRMGAASGVDMTGWATWVLVS